MILKLPVYNKEGRSYSDYKWLQFLWFCRRIVPFPPPPPPPPEPVPYYFFLFFSVIAVGRILHQIWPFSPEKEACWFEDIAKRKNARKLNRRAWSWLAPN